MRLLHTFNTKTGFTEGYFLIIIYFLATVSPHQTTLFRDILSTSITLYANTYQLETASSYQSTHMHMRQNTHQRWFLNNFHFKHGCISIISCYIFWWEHIICAPFLNTFDWSPLYVLPLFPLWWELLESLALVGVWTYLNICNARFLISGSSRILAHLNHNFNWHSGASACSFLPNASHQISLMLVQGAIWESLFVLEEPYLELFWFLS